MDFEKESAQREQEKERLKRALEREGVDTSAAGAHAFLARTPSKVLMVQPEDVFELVEQANLPGTVDQHPNWRRKLPVALERWKSDPRVQKLADTMAERSFSTHSSAPKRVPVATYRLQLHKGFRFADAIALVPYLAALGVSHVYASPFLKARPGSMHGYDVVDHRKINPEIGTEAELDRLIQTLRRHGMGLVLDVVPNHMGVLHGDNPWWQDVLEKGRASPYAKFFDIDWLRGGGRLLLPVLGKHYGEALDDGEVKLSREGRKGPWRITYYDQSFPLSPKSRASVKMRSDPLELHRLLEKQHYRLAFWRVASDEINYRRFFEITDLAALRAEDKAVFDATHALIGRLAKEPGVDGLRIDHPDGLSDPAQYLERLQTLGERPWVLVEKILADYETLPPDWKAHGTTGYRYANLLTGVFVEHAAAARFERIYQRFTGARESFDADLVREPHAHHEHHARRRAEWPRAAPRAHRLRQPAHARLHRERPAQGARRGGCALPGVPQLRHRARRLGHRPALHRLGGEGGAAREPHRRPERVRLREERAHARRGAAGAGRGDGRWSSSPCASSSSRRRWWRRASRTRRSTATTASSR